MKNHLCKKFKCKWKNIETFKSDLDVYKESMIKKYKESDKIYNKFLQINDESNLEEKEETEDKKKEQKCKFCQKVFRKKCNVIYHESSCKVKKIVEQKQMDETKESDKKSPSETFEYTPLLCKFFDAMDMSHISEEKHTNHMLYSSYEKIFEEILKNERNMNFYMFFDKPEIMIYKNEIKDVKKINLEKGYVRICMIIHEYLLKRLEICKMNSNFDDYMIKCLEKNISRINTKYRLHDESRMNFIMFLREFCKENRMRIFSGFSENFRRNKEEMDKK
jgi:hypothetical protein